MDNAALVSSIAAWIGVLVYFYLGQRLSRRPVSAEARVPAGQFTLFWIGLAAVSALGAIESLIAAYQLPSLALVLTMLYLEILLLCAVLWALVGYLVFLFTGRGYLVPLSMLYAALYVLLIYFITASGPSSVGVSYGAVTISYATPVGGPILGVLLILLLGPEFIGAFLYFSLFFRTRDPTIRYRVTLVSWSLIAWFGLGFLNIGALLGGGLAAQVLARSFGVFAALVILMAYYPPRAIRTRFGVSSIDESSRTAAA